MQWLTPDQFRNDQDPSIWNRLIRFLRPDRQRGSSQDPARHLRPVQHGDAKAIAYKELFSQLRPETVSEAGFRVRT